MPDKDLRPGPGLYGRERGRDPGMLQVETSRYVAWPGQATAYMVGMLEIRELRQKAMDELEDRFDLKEFHDVVLSNGSMPLEVLERVVDDYGTFPAPLSSFVWKARKSRKTRRCKVLRKILLFGSMAAVLLAAVVLAGCGPARGVDRGADVAKADVKEILVEKKDSGSRVELEKGQTLVVTLESNPSTGYSWEVAEGAGTVLQQKGEADFKSSSAGDQQLVGAGGTETLRFEAAGAGETTLKLVYYRPWEKGVEPLETFSVQVIVR